MGKYLLSVDNGLTATKSVIFTLDGHEVASGIITTVVENRGRCAEIDMELQWRNTAAVIRESISRAGINPSDIIGVGNSGHGAGLYCLDSSNKPVRKAVSSMDARASDILSRWKEEGKSTFERLQQNLWSGQAIPILSWLKQNEPENYRRIEKILMVKDWIIFRLTGELGVEYTDASNSGLINPTGKTIDKEILELFDVSEMYEKIPPLRKSTDIAGYITSQAAEETGLKAGTPVMGGVFDCIACALGSGVFDNDRYSLIAGTWNVNSAIEEKLINRSETIKCSLYADINRYFYVESSATSAVNLEWFIDNIIKKLGLASMSNREIYRMIDEGVAMIKPDQSDIIYMPFLYKSHLSDNLDACFWGLKPEYNIMHVLRSVFEGVVFAHLKHIENLRNGGINRNGAVLSGGASNSEVWSQMFADILGMEVVTTQASQAGALGTAVCTSVAMGQYKDFKEAINAMVKIKKYYYPDSVSNKSYMQKYSQFNSIINKFDKCSS